MTIGLKEIQQACHAGCVPARRTQAQKDLWLHSMCGVGRAFRRGNRVRTSIAVMRRPGDCSASLHMLLYVTGMATGLQLHFGLTGLGPLSGGIDPSAVVSEHMSCCIVLEGPDADVREGLVRPRTQAGGPVDL